MNSMKLCLLFACGLSAFAQKIPPVQCHVEDYPVKPLLLMPLDVPDKVQVVVLRDPAGEQEARFDLTHGGSLIFLRYRGKEILYGEPAGASLALMAFRQGTEEDLKGMNPYWSAFSPDQGDAGVGMGVSATTTDRKSVV